MRDVFFIAVTAFAFFGLYCFIDALVMSVRYSDAPRTVTIMEYDGSPSAYSTISYIHNTLYNNEIILVADGKIPDCPLAKTLTQEELHKYITFTLFTKN